MSASRTFVLMLFVITTMRAFAQGTASHGDGASTAPAEGAWCFSVARTADAIHVLTGDARARGASLWYSRSHDGGYRWTQPVRVDAGLAAPQPLSKDGHARLLSRGGRLLAVWPVDGITSATAVSADGGHRWRRQDPTEESLSAGSDGSVASVRKPVSWPVLARSLDFARAPDGMLAAVWEERNGASSTVLYALSSDDGRTWQPPERLTEGDSDATHPHVVVADDGFLALWLEKWNSSERLLQRKHLQTRHRH